MVSWSVSEGSADSSGEVDSPVDSGVASVRCSTFSLSSASVGLAEREADMRVGDQSQVRVNNAIIIFGTLAM